MMQCRAPRLHAMLLAVLLCGLACAASAAYSVDDRKAKHTNQGIKFDRNGQPALALAAFRAGRLGHVVHGAPPGRGARMRAHCARWYMLCCSGVGAAGGLRIRLTGGRLVDPVAQPWSTKLPGPKGSAWPTLE
jgi:hypothetical protein